MPLSAPAAFLARLDAAFDLDQVFATHAAREAALAQFGWDEGDMFGLLRVLDEDEFLRVEESSAEEGGTIWVFVPTTAQGRIWVRLCERAGIIVISFHRG